MEIIFVPFFFRIKWLQSSRNYCRGDINSNSSGKLILVGSYLSVRKCEGRWQMMLGKLCSSRCLVVSIFAVSAFFLKALRVLRGFVAFLRVLRTMTRMFSTWHSSPTLPRAEKALSLIVAYDNNANVLLLTPTTINCDSESLIASINVAQLQSSVTLMFIYAIKGRDGVEVKQANENT